MEEDWDLEAKARTEPAFNLQYSTPPQHRPKQSYLKYLKTVHGGEMAAKARSELNYLRSMKGIFTNGGSSFCARQFTRWRILQKTFLNTTITLTLCGEYLEIPVNYKGFGTFQGLLAFLSVLLL